LERGEGDNDNEEESAEKPPNQRSNPVDSQRLSDDFLEYDIIDGSPSELAVALPVDNDDNDDTKLPSAVQYDPNMKPFLFTTRRYYLLIYLLIIAAINGAVGGYIGMISIQQTKDEQYTRLMTIRAHVECSVTKEQLDDKTSPYYKAFDWITFHDPKAYAPDSPNLVQRYFVVYLYFATSTQRPWGTDCAPAKHINITTGCSYTMITQKDDEDVYDELVKFTAERWLSDTNVCQWAGIGCDDAGQIQKIDLSMYYFFMVT
jgi:hypothetical protein